MGQKISRERIIEEPRSLLKRCFKHSVFSLVPFEIWRIIVFNVDLDSINKLLQTCLAFKALAYDVKKIFLEKAFFARKTDFNLAREYLRKSACVPDSMLQLGYAYFFGGWGLERNVFLAWKCFQIAAKQKIPQAYPLCSLFCKIDFGTQRDLELSAMYAKKALDSKSPFAMAYCHKFGLGTPRSMQKALSFFEISAREENFEYSIYMVGVCHYEMFQYDKAYEWAKKAAHEGVAAAQYLVGLMHKYGYGRESDTELAAFWIDKAASQLHQDALFEHEKVLGQYEDSETKFSVFF